MPPIADGGQLSSVVGMQSGRGLDTAPLGVLTSHPRLELFLCGSTCSQRHHLGHLMAQLVKNLPALGEAWVPGLGRSPGAGNSYPLQYSGLENAMECTVHGVAQSQTRWSKFHFH